MREKPGQLVFSTIKPVVLAVLAASVAFGVIVTPPSGDQPYYLFTSFRGNGEDGLHLAISRDGYHWTALNQDRSFLRPSVGNGKLMRDPSLAQAKDGTFHLVWTSCASFNAEADGGKGTWLRTRFYQL